jgi:hypothetical protein
MGVNLKNKVTGYRLNGRDLTSGRDNVFSSPSIPLLGSEIQSTLYPVIIKTVSLSVHYSKK